MGSLSTYDVYTQSCYVLKGHFHSLATDLFMTSCESWEVQRLKWSLRLFTVLANILKTYYPKWRSNKISNRSGIVAWLVAYNVNWTTVKVWISLFYTFFKFVDRTGSSLSFHLALKEIGPRSISLNKFLNKVLFLAQSSQLRLISFRKTHKTLLLYQDLTDILSGFGVGGVRQWRPNWWWGGGLSIRVLLTKPQNIIIRKN